LENKSILTEIGQFSTTDIDSADAFNYKLVSGTGSTDNALFIIEGNTLRSNFSANFENKNSYTIRVATTDKGNQTLESIFIVKIIDVSEKPAIENQVFAMNENDSVNTNIGNLVSTSPDAGANLKYSLLFVNQYFMIDSNSGNIILTNKVDYEKNKTFNFKVIVTDLQNIPLFDTATVTINVNDAIETKQTLPANNYMSPNNDGVNDYFMIDNVALYADYRLLIYNEVGLEVYSIPGNYQNNWDGTYNGKVLKTGVYFYVFRNNKTGEEFKGALNIVNQ
jgi:gliding motility-associated-like protein